MAPPTILRPTTTSTSFSHRVIVQPCRQLSKVWLRFWMKVRSVSSIHGKATNLSNLIQSAFVSWDFMLWGRRPMLCMELLGWDVRRHGFDYQGKAGKPTQMATNGNKWQQMATRKPHKVRHKSKWNWCPKALQLQHKPWRSTWDEGTTLVNDKTCQDAPTVLWPKGFCKEIKQRHLVPNMMAKWKLGNSLTKLNSFHFLLLWRHSIAIFTNRGTKMLREIEKLVAEERLEQARPAIQNNWLVKWCSCEWNRLRILNNAEMWSRSDGSSQDRVMHTVQQLLVIATFHTMQPKVRNISLVVLIDSIRKASASAFHTHAHTHIYIYIYMLNRHCWHVRDIYAQARKVSQGWELGCCHNW